MAQLLLRAGAIKDTKTNSGYTPLHIACHQGHINMVRLLIEHGAEVNPVTSAGYTPLHQAAQQGHVLVINLLLKNKANPNAVTNVSTICLLLLCTTNFAAYRLCVTFIIIFSENIIFH